MSNLKNSLKSDGVGGALDGKPKAAELWSTVARPVSQVKDEAKNWLSVCHFCNHPVGRFLLLSLNIMTARNMRFGGLIVDHTRIG